MEEPDTIEDIVDIDMDEECISNELQDDSSGATHKELCYCTVNSDKNSVGIIYCSKQQVSFEHNFLTLEAQLKEYRKTIKQKSKHVTHQVTEAKLIGMLEVWEHINLFGGFMDLQEAWKRFRCHQYSVPKKEAFLNDLLHDKIGLSVHIVQFETYMNEKIRMVIPKHAFLDVGMLTEYLQEKRLTAQSSEHLRIHTAVTLQQVLPTMDTEYDRAVAKVLVAANMSEAECSSIGLSHDRLKKSITHVKRVVEESNHASLAADDIFAIKMNDKLQLTCSKIEDIQKTIKIHGPSISAKLKNELEQQIVSLETRKDEIDSMLSDGTHGQQKRKRAVTRIKLALLEENRVKRRRTGAGPKEKMDSDDEEFISQCIEEHASVDGRRKQGVLYFSRRLKQKDLLSIMNYHLMECGKKAIKSAKTIMSRAHPHHTRSIQAKKNHRGKWLFCSKKPPKTALHEKIHTRHQRQARKLAKYHAFKGSMGKVSSKDFLILSKDDKAYLRPGTTGEDLFQYYFFMIY